MAAPLKPEIHVSDSPEAMSLYAATLFCSLAREAVARRKVFRAALSGGSTPLRLYALLASEPYRGCVDWQRTDLFFGDERCVPPEHRDSNFKSIDEALLSRVPARAHRIRGEMPPREAALLYEEELKRAFGLKEGIPAFDLVILGVGTDGHTASLFPGSDALAEAEKLAVPVYVERLDSWRVTLTLPVINSSRKVLFLAMGKDKARVVRAVLNGAAGYPASMVAPTEGSVIWVMDREAASFLKPSG